MRRPVLFVVNCSGKICFWVGGYEYLAASEGSFW